METHKVWEGRRGPRLRRKVTFVGGYRRSRRTAFGLRRGVVFVGEELGSWSEGLPFARQRGTDYTVFRTEDGTIIIHRVRRSVRTAADDVGKVYIFSDVVKAVEAGWRRVLENSGAIPQSE